MPVNPVIQWLARAILRLFGWKLFGDFEDIPQAVVIGQHTSNWDGFVGILGALGVGVFPYWLGKAELFRGWRGLLLKAIGGIPVDRSSRQNLVDQVADKFAEHEKFILFITPEGTRKQTDYWRSGFYHIASRAEVPIVQGVMDYKHKQAGVGKILRPTGDMEADIRTLREYYTDSHPKFPENAAPIRFKTQE
jgi:1-acyl-sn-glycerol-3-phosphate acyltransferase